ncbi:MAG: transposase [Sphingomonas sp.]
MTGPERRRRWSDQEQREILAAAFSPGAVVSDVCKRGLKAALRAGPSTG